MKGGRNAVLFKPFRKAIAETSLAEISMQTFKVAFISF
jgi:hypothetical protein